MHMVIDIENVGFTIINYLNKIMSTLVNFV